MKFKLKSLICTIVLVFSSQPLFGLGQVVEITSLQLKPKDSQYIGLNQTTRELRFTTEDNIFIEYSISGKRRRLWDDDGLATLFTYHRSLTSDIMAQKISETSPLPQPIQPVLRALEFLRKTYNSIGKSEIVSRIDTVRAEIANGRIVRDVRSSGLEALINDLMENHTYRVERDGDSDIRKKIFELIGSGTPSQLTTQLAARCRDTINLDWRSATTKFASGESTRGAGPSQSAPAGR